MAYVSGVKFCVCVCVCWGVRVGVYSYVFVPVSVSGEYTVYTNVCVSSIYEWCIVK